ncbi:hypothetical protein ACSSVY_000432 [Roseovarius sp. MBR-51]
MPMFKWIACIQQADEFGFKFVRLLVGFDDGAPLLINPLRTPLWSALLGRAF